MRNMLPTVTSAWSATLPAFAEKNMAFVAFAKASSDNINPLLVSIKLFSSSNNDCADILLDNIVLYHADCEDTLSIPTKRLYSLIRERSFEVIAGEMLLNNPFIPFADIAFFKSAKLLLKIPILFIAPFKSVVIVLNILLCYTNNKLVQSQCGVSVIYY